MTTVSSSAWKWFRGDTNHTGRSLYAGPLSSNVKWKYCTNEAIVSSPVINTAESSPASIVFGSYDTIVYSLKFSTGSLQWRYSTNGLIRGTPAIDGNGNAIVASSDNNLYSLNQAGSLVWSVPNKDAILASVALDTNGRAYYAQSYSNVLVSVESSDSSLAWKLAASGTVEKDTTIVGYPTTSTVVVSTDTIEGSVLFPNGTNVWSSPLVDSQNNVYVGIGNTLYAYSQYTLLDDKALLQVSLLWTYRTAGIITNSPALGDDNTIYVGDSAGFLYAIVPDKIAIGSLKWSYPLGSSVLSSVAISVNGSVYVGGSDAVYALEATTGSLVWRYSTKGGSISSPAIDSHGNVYIGTQSGTVLALRSTGSLIWSFRTGAAVSSSPTIHDGYLFVGSQDQCMYAFDGAPKDSSNSDTLNDGAIAGIVIGGVVFCAIVCVLLFFTWSHFFGKGLLATNGKSVAADDMNSIGLHSKTGGDHGDTL